MKPVMHRHSHRKKKNKFDLKQVVRTVLGVFLLLAGSMHFINTSEYVMIVPKFIPLHKVVIYLSGLIEITIGILFITNKYRRLAAWGAILFYLAVLPVTIAFKDSPGAVVASIPWLAWGRVPIVIIIMLIAFWNTKD